MLIRVLFLKTELWQLNFCLWYSLCKYRHELVIVSTIDIACQLSGEKIVLTHAFGNLGCLYSQCRAHVSRHQVVWVCLSIFTHCLCMCLVDLDTHSHSCVMLASVVAHVLSVWLSHTTNDKCLVCQQDLLRVSGVDRTYAL